MKNYLIIDIEVLDNTELIVKIEPIYCADPNTQSVITIADDDYIPSKGDKLYFLPGVNVPRIKLKDLSLQYGIKTIRDIEQATHVFAGKNTTDKITTGSWYYSIPTSNLQQIYDCSSGIMDDRYRENIRQALESYTEDIILMGGSSAGLLRNTQLDILQNLDMTRYSSHYYTVDDNYKDLFPAITTLKIFNENKLLKYINGEDAAIIDEVMFTQICDMFNSSDQDNHVMAMEIMANCNYIDSLLYIEMLFEKHSSEMGCCNTKNHVNFKSLISFLGKNKSYLTTDVDTIIKSLIVKNVFDIEKVNVIMKYYGDWIARRGGTNYFEVKSITLNEEGSKLLNTNYVYETFPDFILKNEVNVDVPEIHGNLDDLIYSSNETPKIEEIEEVASDTKQVDVDFDEIPDSIIVTKEMTESEVIEQYGDLMTEEEIEIINETSDITDNSEEEIIKEDSLPVRQEEELNNNQIKETNGEDFEWF